MAGKQNEVVAIDHKINKLANEVEFIASLSGIEKMAREKLKYIKEGEVIIVPVKM